MEINLFLLDLVRSNHSYMMHHATWRKSKFKINMAYSIHLEHMVANS